MAAKEMKQSNYVPGEISQRFLSNSSKTGRLNDIFGNLKPGKSEEPQKLKVNHEETEISQPKKQKRKIFEIEETGIFSNNEENITDTNEELPKKKKSKKEKQKKSSNQEEKKSKQKRKKEIKTKVEEVNEDLEDEIKIEDKLDEEEEDKINEFPNENEKIDRDLQNEEKLKKTIFIGNLPVQLGIKALKKVLLITCF